MSLYRAPRRRGTSTPLTLAPNARRAIARPGKLSGR
jgi:hypothetical protein